MKKLILVLFAAVLTALKFLPDSSDIPSVL